MGLKWRLVPQSETREIHFGARRFAHCANLCLLRSFRAVWIPHRSPLVDSELHSFQVRRLPTLTVRFRARPTMPRRRSFQTYCRIAGFVVLAATLTGCLSSPTAKKQKFFNQGEQAFKQ